MSDRRSDEGLLVSGPSVELPGIETGTKVALTCGNGQSDDAKYAKRRENTCGDAESVDGINTPQPLHARARRGSTDPGERAVGGKYLLLLGCSEQNGPTEPLANEQRNFNVEPVVAERPASALDGALDPVLDGNGMQVELVSRRFVAAATA